MPPLAMCRASRKRQDAGRSVPFMLADVVFLAALGALLLAAVQLYSRSGSGISHHPYLHVHGGAPGAARASRMSGSVDQDLKIWSRGTR